MKPWIVLIGNRSLEVLGSLFLRRFLVATRNDHADSRRGLWLSNQFQRATHTATEYLIVDDGAAAIELYKKAFEAKEVLGSQDRAAS